MSSEKRDELPYSICGREVDETLMVPFDDAFLSMFRDLRDAPELVRKALSPSSRLKQPTRGK